MGPLPYPHRATFLASTLTVPVGQDALVPYLARLVSVIVFDHLLRHPVVTLGDHDDERLIDDRGRLLDVRHPQIEDSIDWFFRISRRHEVLWLELGFDRVRLEPPVLRARRPGAADEAWHARPDATLSQQLDQCLAQWLAARRLPPVGPLPGFDLEDLRSLAERLITADGLLVQGRELGIVPRSLTQPPARLPVPFLRVLAELSRDDARTLDPIILGVDPTHPVARRNRYVAGLAHGETDRRDILPLLAEAPMYARPHLSIWGETFAGDRALERMAVRHQGIAASLMPANPYACHNYSLQLAEDGRREESYRWADRATVVAPQLGAAHLDCVRRLRQVGRPGQAFAEAQYRHREILDRAEAGKLAAGDWQAPYHAALLVAFVHLDVGRLAEAIERADEVMAELPDEPAAREAFAWAARRIARWKSEPALLARAYACEGHHRGDVGRVVSGLTRGPLTSEDDAMMRIDALCTLGREAQAVTTYWQCAGLDGLLGDGKARLAAARALILTGDLDEALDQIQIVQLRRSQSRLEAEINRLLRLAAIWPAHAWAAVIERRRARGARTLAQMAARDLVDFVASSEPGEGLDTPAIRALLGLPHGPPGRARRPRAIDPLWIAELVAAVPAAQSSSPAIVARLAPPAEATLAAADAHAAEWWTVLVPSARDRDAHAAGAMLALGLSIASYLALAAGPPTPLAGAYRHIATEALQLVRRARYQIEVTAITAVLRLLEQVSTAEGPGGPEADAVLDTWLLRVERALDLEAEHGAYLAGMLAGLPTVARWLRGDERIGWELRLAHDLAADPSQYEPAAALFARSARAVESGSTLHAWSAAAIAAPVAAQLDVHWTAALANPTGAAGPWLRLAQLLLATGNATDGLRAACRGMAATAPAQRTRAAADLGPARRAAYLATPLDGALAFDLGVTAAAEGRVETAVTHLRWAVATDPSHAPRAHALAEALVRLGRGHEALQVIARHERSDAPGWVARALIAQGRDADAVELATGETDARLAAQTLPPGHTGAIDRVREREACDQLAAGAFDALVAAVSSPSWGIARVALAACEWRRDDESGVPVSPRALEAALEILRRSAGATEAEAVHARIRALRIRDNAFIQIDPPPPLGTQDSRVDFERAYAARLHASSLRSDPRSSTKTRGP